MNPNPRNPLAAIRRFARPRPRQPESCELCKRPDGAAHQHLLESTRNLACSCDACAVLFGDQHAGGYRRVPAPPVAVGGFSNQRLGLGRLAYSELHSGVFLLSQRGQRMMAYFPSPACATESRLPLDSWQELETANPVLRQMQPDVEALLVNRVHQAREYYLAPLDQCYRLVGLIRAHWRGLAGGARAWEGNRPLLCRLAKACAAAAGEAACLISISKSNRPKRIWVPPSHGSISNSA